jgi:hypothetical protein
MGAPRSGVVLMHFHEESCDRTSSRNNVLLPVDAAAVRFLLESLDYMLHIGRHEHRAVPEHMPFLCGNNTCVFEMKSSG